ncbi:MAG: hypothetical protein KAR42_15275 [candidate division Zixibacteria bacterium]|nr:hypothetical protein [candidate division Zixibacteria bacterium]
MEKGTLRKIEAMTKNCINAFAAFTCVTERSISAMSEFTKAVGKVRYKLMEKRLLELFKRADRGLSIKECDELLDLVCRFALGKEPKQSVESNLEELKKILTGPKDKEVVNAIQKVLVLMEGERI